MDNLNKLFMGILLCLSAFAVVASEPDWRDYDDLLKKYVATMKKDGVVVAGINYQGLKANPLYEKVLTQIQNYDVDALKTAEEKLAFYINAYNIFAIKMIEDHWPLQSIKDAGSLFGSVWKKDIGQIKGRSVNLHHIEHEILRKMHEPRIHMAIVCASVSCPDLRNEAYTAAKLELQLEDQSRTFVLNSAKGLQLTGNKLKVSKIFDWFAEDFNSYGGVLTFVKKYRPDLPKNITIDSYLPYNWKLNSQN